MIYAFRTYKITQDKLVKKFIESSGQPFHMVEPKFKSRTAPNFVHEWPDLKKIEDTTNKDVQVVWSGFQRNTKLIYQKVKESHRDFYYLDHPYFFHPDYVREKKDTNGDKWNNTLYGQRYFRATKNCFNCTTISNTDDGKYKQWLKDEKDHPELIMKDWRKKGTHVLVLPPSPTLYNMIGKDDKKLLNDTLTILKKHTDRPIRVRYKKTDKGYPRTDIYDDLKDCWAVVSFGTAASVKAIMSGIPVFCNEYSPTYPVGEKDFTKIETPKYPERENWLYNLINNQFSVREIDDKKFNVYKYLNKEVKQ